MYQIELIENFNNKSSNNIITVFQSGIMSWFLATDLQLQPFAYTYCYFLAKSPKKAFKWGLLIGSIFLFANTYPFFLYDVTLAQKSNAVGDLDAVNGLNYLAHYHRYYGVFQINILSNK